VLLLERIDVATGEADQAVVPVQQALGEFHHADLARSGAQQQRQQFGVRQAANAAAQRLFARPVAFGDAFKSARGFDG
jgi:hypothetical protein